MSEEKKIKHWVIDQNELAAIQEFIGSLALPWKQTNPYMQLLTGLKPVNYQAAPNAPSASKTPPKTPKKTGFRQIRLGH